MKIQIKNPFGVLKAEGQANLANVSRALRSDMLVGLCGLTAPVKKVNLILLLLVALGAFISTGCRSVSTNETKASQTVGKWVPAGTSLSGATKIFKQHGFTYNPEATSSCSPLGDVVFDKTGPIHYWTALVHLENGKTTTNISVTVCLNPRYYLHY